MNYTIPNIEGWMFKGELEWLYNTALTMKSIVEIGSWKGRSTHALLSGCSGPVIAVDTFKGLEAEPSHITSQQAKQFNIYSILKQNVGHFPNLMVMKMESKRAAKFFKPKSVDMIFLDGSHDYWEVRQDIISWLPICKVLLCGHDYDNCLGVNNALRDLKVGIKKVEFSIWEHRIQ